MCLFEFGLSFHNSQPSVGFNKSSHLRKDACFATSIKLVGDFAVFPSLSGEFNTLGET